MARVNRSGYTLPTMTDLDLLYAHLPADHATRGSEALTAQARHAVPLLRKRRAVLISAAGTGQIDVPHLAPSLTV